MIATPKGKRPTEVVATMVGDEGFEISIVIAEPEVLVTIAYSPEKTGKKGSNKNRHIQT